MNSIAGSTNSVQVPLDGSSHIDMVVPIAGNDMSTGSQQEDLAQQPQASSASMGESGFFNKYGYDEFAGFSGKRYLDKILQQILTYAIWRTWHFSDEFVAPGNDCYVGPYRLAAEIRPGIRKVEMDFKALRELGLMTV